MNNNLKICLIIYKTMNTISKPLLSSLEVTASEVIDYGIPDINKFFQTLDVETKKKITKHTNKEIQKNILKL